MIRLLILIFLFMPAIVWSQYVEVLRNANGSRYVGETLGNEPNGEGIEYRSNGSISRSGRWQSGSLVKQYSIPSRRFPFNGSASRPVLTPQMMDQNALQAELNAKLMRVAPLEEAHQRALRENINKQVANLSKVDPLKVDPSHIRVDPVNFEFRNTIAQRVQPLDESIVDPTTRAQSLEGRTHSSLQPCAVEGVKNNCWGEFRGLGWRYIGEFQNGASTGEGIRYLEDGSVAESGRWVNNSLVQPYAISTTRFPFNLAAGAMVLSPPIPEAEAARTERDRLTAEVVAERKKRQELEVRLAAESKERERLALEAKAQERLAQEAKDREKDLAEARERERLLAEAKEREQRSPSPPVQVASPKNPHALIIGNAAYPGSSRLDNPINDAKAIEQKLKSMGFTVTVVTDANRQRLVQAMSQFRNTASNADLSLLFYSGHGVQIFGTNYILPIDVDQTDVAQATIQGVSLNSVIENFLPGKTKIVFLDACRDNPLQRSSDRSVSKGLAPISV